MSIRKKLKFKLKRFFKKYGRSVKFGLLFLIIFLAVSFLIFPPLKTFVFGMFIVNKIDVEGVFYNDLDDVKDALSMYKGRVNWQIDRDEVRKNLKQDFKWIKSVGFSNFPSRTFKVYVVEYKPILFYKDKIGELWIVGENGHILNKFNVKKSGFLFLPVLSCKREDISFVVSKLKAIFKQRESENLKAELSEIIVKDRDSKWIVYLNDFKAKIFVDPFGTFENFDIFCKLKRHFETNYSGLEYVDLSFANQIIVKPKD